MPNIIYHGLPLTGKTTALFDQYKQLTKKYHTDNILVLVADSQQVGRWREELADIPVTGSLRIFSYWGFIQSEIARYWNWVANDIFPDSHTLKPTFINAEAAHYLMTTLITQVRPQGMFDSVVATPHRIALQILNVINYAGISGYGYEEAYLRLKSAMGDESDKRAALLDAITLANKYRKVLAESQCIDYGMALELYNKHLLTNPQYYELLKRTYKCLMVDNLEESFPVTIDLIELLLNSVEAAYIAYDPTGGHTKYFGADPDYAIDKLRSKLIPTTLDTLYGGSEEAPILVNAVTNNILHGHLVTQASVKKPQFEIIASDYRSESISLLVARVEKLITGGCPPGEIGIITPSIDRILDITLSAQAQSKGIPLECLNRKEFLTDETFAQVMVTLASMINTDITGNKTELARTLGLILDLDPIRSNILASHCQLRGLTPLSTELLTRVGFAANHRYQEFCTWVERIKATVSDENLVFQHLFSELVAPLIQNYEDIITSRQIIKSAMGYEKIQNKIPVIADVPFLNGFVEMIRQGTVAADVIRIRDIKPEAVVLATPVTLFKSGRSFTYQFWLDCSSDLWYHSDVSELNNPHILTRNWDGQWDDNIDRRKKAENAARTVSGLIYRCHESITMLVSDYNSLGMEQEGNLHELVAESVVRP